MVLAAADSSRCVKTNRLGVLPLMCWHDWLQCSSSVLTLSSDATEDALTTVPDDKSQHCEVVPGTSFLDCRTLALTTVAQQNMQAWWKLRLAPLVDTQATIPTVMGSEVRGACGGPCRLQLATRRAGAHA